MIPVPSTWSAPAGTSGSVAFHVHNLGGAQELADRWPVQSDANNFGGHFTGGAPPESVILAAGATTTVNVPTTIPASAYAGNSNAVQLSVATLAGDVSSAAGMAMASASLPDSLPTALIPVGVTPFSEAATGRDGPAYLGSRGLWLVPCGADGVRVIRNSATDSIGPIDADGDGDDDRVVGTIRIPGFAASLAIIPGFVTALGETLDVGLLAAGRGGLMLLDLRVVEDLSGTGATSSTPTETGSTTPPATIPVPVFCTDAAGPPRLIGPPRALALTPNRSNPFAVDYNGAHQCRPAR